MRGKLFFNGELIDAEITVPLAIGGNQLNDLNNKRANQTATIIIEKNEKYHEDSEIWNSEIFVDYSISGVNVIRRGKLKVNKFTDTHVHLTVYFGLYDLAEKLKDTKITEIDPIDDYINWSITIVKDTLVDDTNNHFVFLFVNSDTFEQSEFNQFSNTIHAKRFIPAARVTHILETMESYFNIQFEGLKSDPMIQQLFMPVVSNMPANNQKGSLIYSNIINPTITYVGTTGIANEIVKLPIKPNSETGTIVEIVNGTKFKITKTGNYKSVLNIKLLIIRKLTLINPNEFPMTYSDVDNNYIVGQLYNITSSELVFSTQILSTVKTNLLYFHQDLYDLPFGFENISLIQNNEYEFRLSIYSKATGTPFLNHDYQWRIFQESLLQITPMPIQFSSSLDMQFPIFANLPEMTCMDFLKSLIQKRGMLLDYDDVNEIYIFSYFEDVFSKQAEDWSEFFISAELTDVYGVTAKENIFEYDNDDYLPENLGSYSHFVNKDTLPNETVILQDKTSATQMQPFRTDFICRLPIIKDDKKEFEKIKPRFLLVEKGSISGINITDGVNTYPLTNQNLAYFDKLGKQYSLDYAKIVPEQYAEYTDILSNFRKYEAKMQLKANVLDRDQSIPIYISQLKSRFFVNKINFTSDTQLSTVELIKI
jgi:hypothetical protein